jgi:UDP-N-acetylglucosamine enolpyruvyl transferase
MIATDSGIYWRATFAFGDRSCSPAACAQISYSAVTALLIAALTADDTSTIRGRYHLRRGNSHLLANSG